MRWGMLTIIGFILTGCAAQPPQPPVAQVPPTIASTVYDGAVAASLIYNPPVSADIPRLQVDREGRQMSAYAGFEDQITTFYYLRVDDYQRSDGHHHHGNSDRFEREAITERVGVSYR